MISKSVQLAKNPSTLSADFLSKLMGLVWILCFCYLKLCVIIIKIPSGKQRILIKTAVRNFSFLVGKKAVAKPHKIIKQTIKKYNIGGSLNIFHFKYNKGCVPNMHQKIAKK